VVTALALENEFHGMFAAQLINSNFNRTVTTDYSALNDGFYNPAGVKRDRSPSNFIEQRARLQYTAKANADLKLVTHFELDYAYWGNNSYTVARNGGAAIGADTVNIETKSIYLDANPFKNVNMKLGMMPNTDAFKGVVFDSDMAGILFSSNYGNFTPSIGYFRFVDNSPSATNNGTPLDNPILGRNTSDMFMLDGKIDVSKELKIGGAYYFFRDNQAGTPDRDIKIHALGLNGEYSRGPLTLSGFLLFEGGTNAAVTGQSKDVTSFAGNFGAKIKAGPGTARGEFLYVMGGGNNGGNAFYAINGEHGYYNNEMVIMGRDKNAYTTDNSIIYNADNKGQGQFGTFLGYDLPVSPKLTTAANLGFAWIAHKNNNTPINLNDRLLKNGTNFLGTEVNAEATYTLLEGLTAGVRFGYVVLGGYYRGVALASNGVSGAQPENPYDFKLMVKYSF